MIYLVSKTTKEHFDASKFSPEDANDEDLTAVTADGNGWVLHKGNECPVPDDSRVQVQYALSRRKLSTLTWPQDLSWRQDCHPNGRIIAYRPILSDDKCTDERPCIPCFTDDGPCEDESKSGVKGQVTVSVDEPEMPCLGDKYVHHNGNVYRVTGFANLHTERPDEYPVMVIYQGVTDGKVWSRPLKDWARSFVPDKEVEAMRELLNNKFGRKGEAHKPSRVELCRFLVGEGYRKVEKRRDEKG